MPTSRTSTQSVAGLIVPESCGVVPAWPLADAPANGTHFESAVTPMLSPITIVDGGPAAVSVVSTSPACVTGKL